jgi:hypothetical protein
MLRPSDEMNHTPAPIANWQENYVWHAWNPTTRCGWNLHLGNLNDQSLIDVRAHVIVDGQVCAGSRQEPGTEIFGVSGLQVDVATPFEAMRLRYEGHGRRGPDADGWLGRDGGDVPFGFDIRLVTEHPPFEAVAFPSLTPGIDESGNHYELGGRWQGRVWSGDTERHVDGLLVRDHSWGGRRWPWDECFWVPMVLDGGRRFIFNVAQRYEGRWLSCSVALDANGDVDVAEEVWVRFDGEGIPRRFSRVEILRAGQDSHEIYTLDGEIHLPVGRAHSRVGLSDMYSTVRGDGRVGFSTFQTFPTAAEVTRGFAGALAQFA